MIEPIGLLGLLAIVTAWVPETVKNLRARAIRTRLEFLVLYTLGSLLLTIHAVLIHDLIFIVLNALATALSGANLVLKLLSHVWRVKRV